MSPGQEEERIKAIITPFLKKNSLINLIIANHNQRVRSILCIIYDQNHLPGPYAARLAPPRRVPPVCPLRALIPRS